VSMKTFIEAAVLVLLILLCMATCYLSGIGEHMSP
jgi:hypothetical protein